MQLEEKALAFRCGEDHLYGVLSAPPCPAARGVLIVVGGPQYRAGSHRQFTLLARSLAAAGTPAMRFDYRGMGDSEGAPRDFTAVGDDLAAAIDHFFAVQPGLREVVLWGLCDAASAILFYAGADHRVAGIALLNPWARTEEGLARATLKHYYGRRLLAPEFWAKLARGRFDVAGSARSAWRMLAAAAGSPAPAASSLSERMREGLARFDGKVLLMLSGADLTAREFAGLAAGSPEWQDLLGAPRVTRQQLAGADHTCSRRVWQDQVAEWTSAWLRAW
ncbi:hydrolase 1, exosortase A system-associated [Massilia sp. R2A-15]|uniref:hydrolase 1, exosortase A system-associated n=1 Tax=Massilia sp. R2A-15 TaxID=3064278 RepID=UPI0027353AB9|nr:hydrolase 1, exosortase A system-associated [Massilia sp. R2A-15]WLI88925.1 hydrolase 1, exosortase A system-associated [Massilia sp. R2A-15]